MHQEGGKNAIAGWSSNKNIDQAQNTFSNLHGMKNIVMHPEKK